MAAQQHKTFAFRLCLTCGIFNPENYRHCYYCGNPLSSDIIIRKATELQRKTDYCPNCAAELLENSNFCGKCGKLSAEKKLLQSHIYKQNSEQQFLIARYTHRGNLRTLNEDCYAIELIEHKDFSKTGVYLLADGMGGLEAGDRASKLAIQTITQYLHDNIDPRKTDLSEAGNLLQKSFEQAHKVLQDEVLKERSKKGMGSTIVAAIANSEGFTVKHIGDSRAYLLNPGNILQLTEDHTLANSLARQGIVGSSDSAPAGHKNILIYALGIDIASEHNFPSSRSSYQMNNNDALLLCSDGLSVYLSNEEIFTIYHSHESVQKAAKRMLETALERGGKDNISLILIKAMPRNVRGIQ